MATAQQFNVTYYVSMVLAYGGTLAVESDRLIFTPGVVERAVGVSNTEIPYGQIKMVEVTGTITESLVVRTAEKAHRFVGSDPYKIKEIIEQSLNTAVPALAPAPLAVASAAAPAQKVSPVPSPSAVDLSKKSGAGACPGCKSPVRSDYLFCPQCSTVLKLSCGQCREVVEKDWKFCAFCGVTFSK